MSSGLSLCFNATFHPALLFHACLLPSTTAQTERPAFPSPAWPRYMYRTRPDSHLQILLLSAQTPPLLLTAKYAVTDWASIPSGSHAIIQCHPADETYTSCIHMHPLS